VSKTHEFPVYDGSASPELGTGQYFPKRRGGHLKHKPAPLCSPQKAPSRAAHLLSLSDFFRCFDPLIRGQIYPAKIQKILTFFGVFH
jgi:hypothetical protein